MCRSVRRKLNQQILNSHLPKCNGQCCLKWQFSCSFQTFTNYNYITEHQNIMCLTKVHLQSNRIHLQKNKMIQHVNSCPLQTTCSGGDLCLIYQV
uniref:Uncharacterized protein n=1 Tax=Anguilla anguilla TaxID=7936 RepID=A0A0E9X3A8_ANGAN